MANNLVFRWPKPLFFGAHGSLFCYFSFMVLGLMVVCSVIFL